MRTRDQLRQILGQIDGRSYKAYRDIKGLYDFGSYSLSIDHVQADPFASPSRLSVRVDSAKAAFPKEFFLRKIRRVALCDFLARVIQQSIRERIKGRRGTGKSGLFTVDSGRQEVLERNSVVIYPSAIEARLCVGLPAGGRTVLAHQAQAMLFEELPGIVEHALFYSSLSSERLKHHVQVVEDQEALRAQLEEQTLVAFVANDSMLPRNSGVDDRPLWTTEDRVVPFISPPELEVGLVRPNLGPIRGMGLRNGVTLIAGGGFHGKSTLLCAIERGIFNHIPGDGREWTVTVESAVKIRAEDGRYVEKVDISPFIQNLPFEKSTTEFSTRNASGSTSQAANIMEALEMGTKLLLIDEDTSATNFIIRDARMQALVKKSQEPITPFLDKVQSLLTDRGISTVLVMGGSGDYFEVADHVLVLDRYRPHYVTEQARTIVDSFPTRRQKEGGDQFGSVSYRRPWVESFDPSRGKREVKIGAKGLKSILFGTTSIDLTALEQLVDFSQTRAIGEAIYLYATRYAPRHYSLKEGLDRLLKELDEGGLDVLSPVKVGNLARPRGMEIAFSINRMRTLRVERVPARSTGPAFDPLTAIDVDSGTPTAVE